MAEPAPIPDASPAGLGEHVMQCMEVWGGNQGFDSSLVLAGLDMWVYSRPHGRALTGGDVYYVSSCATGRVTRLIVADVTGHGAAVHELAVGLRSLMRRYVNYIDQNRFVRAMNGQFVELSRQGSFATAVAMTFFGPTRRFSLSNAGHPPPLIRRAGSDRWTYLEHRRTSDRAVGDVAAEAEGRLANLPLGIVDLSDYDQFDVDVNVGDLVLCYTDSLPESYGADGVMLGQAGLLRVINDVPVGDPATFIHRLLDHIRSLQPGNLEGDDVTALLCRPNGTASTTPLVERIKGVGRMVRGIVRSWRHKDEPAPWPEPTVANIGGAIVPPLSGAATSNEAKQVSH